MNKNLCSSQSNQALGALPSSEAICFAFRPVTSTPQLTKDPKQNALQVGIIPSKVQEWEKERGG